MTSQAINIFFILPSKKDHNTDNLKFNEITNVIKNPESPNINEIPSTQKHKIIKLQATVGQNLLDVIAQNEDIQHQYIPGNCGGKCACSTCHIAFYKHDYDKFKLNDDISDLEDDMLYSAYDPCSTSRLACQVTVTPGMNNLVVQIMFNGYDTI